MDRISIAPGLDEYSDFITRTVEACEPDYDFESAPVEIHLGESVRAVLEEINGVLYASRITN